MLLEFLLKAGTATESSLHCKQSNRLYLFVYADAGEIKFSLSWLLEFFLLRIGTATEPSLHCKQSNRFYLFVYAEAGRNKIREPNRETE